MAPKFVWFRAGNAQPLHQQAVRLHLHEVARRRVQKPSTKRLRSPRPRRPARCCCCARCRPPPCCAPTGLAICSSPSDHVASMRSSAPQRRVEMPNTMWFQRQTASGLRSSGRFVRRTASAGSFLSSVANSLPRSVVTTKFPSSPASSRAARLVARPTVSAFLFCRGLRRPPG